MGLLFLKLRACLGMVAAAAILFACLLPQDSRASDSGPSIPTAALRDSIAVQLHDHRFDEAVTGARELVSIFEKAGATAGDLASGLETLARCLRRSGRFRQTETLQFALQATAICRENPDVEPDVFASALNTLGLIYFQRSDNQEALPLFHEATEIWLATHGPDDQRVATGLHNQGLVLEAVGNNDSAREVWEQALVIYASRSAESEYRIKQAQTTMALAKLALKLGNYDHAQQLGDSAVEIYRDALGPDNPRLGSALGDLAALARTRGDLGLAIELYQRSLAILKLGYGPNHSEVGRILNNLGNVYADQGQIAQARSCFERALTITEQTQGSDSPQTGVRLLNLASILTEVGDLDLAFAYLSRAEEIFQTRLSEGHLYMGYASQELGGVLAERGEIVAGLSRLNSALVIFEKQLGPDHMAVGELRQQMGSLLIDSSRFGEADDHLALALNLVEKKFPSGHPLLVEILGSMGRLERLKGNPESALSRLDEGLDLGSQLLGEDHPQMATLHLEKARALAAAGQAPEAFSEALSAETIGRRQFILAAIAFEERRALTMSRYRVRGLDLATGLALSMVSVQGSGSGVHALWDEVIRSRGLVREIMARRRQDFASGTSPADSGTVHNLRLAARDYAQLIVAGPGDATPTTYAHELEQARGRWENLERKTASAGHARQTMSSILHSNLNDIADGLSSSGTLVAFTKYQDENDGLAKFAALVLRPPHMMPEIIPLGPASQIAKAVARWRHLLQVGAQNKDGVPLVDIADVMSAGRSVTTLIWDPLSLNENEPVFLVPEAEINLVDFLALPRLEGGFLVENEAEIRLLSSERDLLWSPHDKTTGPRALLVMGGADFGDSRKMSSLFPQGDCTSYRNLVFTDLPGTRSEAKFVSALWTDLEAGPSQCLLGPAASEQAFKTKAPDFRIAHLATHGFFLNKGCGNTLPGTRGVGYLGIDPGPASHPSTINPLLLSGLAFAGANDKHRADDPEDGILTAYEVAAMDLGNLDLAVLSACQTGEGDINDGEGIMGLRRAFATAGVPNLVMSLGSVRDDTAQQWMELFYRHHLNGRLDFHQASRKATRALLEKRRQEGLSDHPAYWAPFIVVGPGH